MDTQGQVAVPTTAPQNNHTMAPTLTRDSFNSQSLGRATNVQVKQVCSRRSIHISPANRLPFPHTRPLGRNVKLYLILMNPPSATLLPPEQCASLLSLHASFFLLLSHGAGWRSQIRIRANFGLAGARVDGGRGRNRLRTPQKPRSHRLRRDPRRRPRHHRSKQSEPPIPLPT